MRYEIVASAEGFDYLGGIRIRADTARKAVQRAEEMARRGMREIRITSPDGRCYGTREFRVTAGLDDRSPLPKSLDPAAIQIAVSAYEAVMGSLNAAPEERFSRGIVARSILEAVFSGERNPVLLRDAAMAKLRSSANAVGFPAAPAR